MNTNKIEIVQDTEITAEEWDVYNYNNLARKKGITHEEMVKVYNDWAENYDKELRPGLYNGAEIVVNALAELIPENKRKDVKILDVAAGTGRVGYLLQKLGFQKVDALDPAEKMLEILKQKGIYSKVCHDSIGLHQTEISDDEYDAVLTAGAMAEGHVPVSAIYEMVRISKKGGIIMTIIREEYLTKVEEYTGKLEECFKILESENKIKKVSRTVVPNYSFKKNGVLYVYEVL